MIHQTLASLVVPLGSVQRYPGNPRTHNLDVLRTSLRRNGQYRPVVVNRRTMQVLAGNGTHEAAELEGWPEIAATMVDVDEQEAARIVAVDNRASDLGGYDDSALLAILEGLPDLEGTGYDQDALDALEALVHPGGEGPALTDPDDVPEPPAEPITRPGDLWLLGPHRLLCGDATDPAAHDRLLAVGPVDLVLTDPPYGVNIDYGRAIGDYKPFEDTPEYVEKLIVEVLPLMRRWPVVLATTGHRCLWRYPPPDWLLAWIVPAGSGQGPWGFTTWHPIIAYGRDPYLARGKGSRPDSITMLATRDPSVEGHPVIKPIEVWKWLLERGSPEPGQVVLDPFGGAGTSIIAAHALNRRCMAIELSPAYVDVACRRYQEHTGTKPTLEATGEPHDFTA